MKYLNKGIDEIHELLKSKKIKPIDLVEEAFENIEKNYSLLADRLGVLVQEDGIALALALAHLAAAVEAGNFYQLAAEVESLGQREHFALVHIVEPLGKGARHFEMLLLVFAHGHLGGFVYQDVGGHERGVGQQAGIDVVGILAHLVLERGDALQLAQVGVHVEEEIQLDGLGQVALQVDGGLFGVEAASQILHKDLPGVAVEVVGCGVRGERMVIGYEEIAVVLVLHLDKVAQSAEIIAQMQVARRADAAAYNLAFDGIRHRLEQIIISILNKYPQDAS